MSSPFHAGELVVQKRVGVGEQARDLKGMYRDVVPPAVAEFLSRHPFAVLSSEDANRNLWASPLAGAGIFSVPDPHDVCIQLDHLDPRLDPALAHGPLAGLLVVDFERRLRLRINGFLDHTSDALTLRVTQFYGNCQKYIQRRVPDSDRRGATEIRASATANSLNDARRTLISRSDTFFIATQHEESSADASHRGGRPGFVRVQDESTLLWPDYRGNNMFNTVGNLEADPRAGLLFIDFDSGTALQLTGKASADFEDPSSFSPTGRSIRFNISSIRELPPSAFLWYSLIEAFPYNPPVAD